MCRLVKLRLEAFGLEFFRFSCLVLGFAVISSASRCTGADEPTPAQALQLAREASKAATKKLVSAIGNGEYSRVMQRKGDDKPTLWANAKVDVHFDQGKYHVKLLFEKDLATFEVGGGKPKIADNKYDDIRIIVDGDIVYVVKFSDRIHPTGCSGEIYSKDQSRTAWLGAGFDFPEPAQLWKILPDMDQLIEKNGADKIKFSQIGAGRFRAVYPPDKPYFTEFEVDREVGFNAMTSRTFNRKDKNPVYKTDVKWKQTNNTWYVTEIAQESDYRDVDPNGDFSRSVFKYEAFDANAKVDPDLFLLRSVPIPLKTRFIDRRKKPAAQFRYWNGTTLQVSKPLL